MIIKTHAGVVPPGYNGNSDPRLIFNGGAWEAWVDSISFCVHGEKLRWTCDECDEYFSKRPWKALE